MNLAKSLGRGGHKAGMKLALYAPFFEYRSQRPNQDLSEAITEFMDASPEDAVMKPRDVDPRTLKDNLKRLERVMAPRKK